MLTSTYYNRLKVVIRPCHLLIISLKIMRAGRFHYERGCQRLANGLYGGGPTHQLGFPGFSWVFNARSAKPCEGPVISRVNIEFLRRF